jgi:glutamyl-tRNA synthetase
LDETVLARIHDKPARSRPEVLASRRPRVTRIGLPAVTSETTGVRVRFAPSPTGVLHVGGARSALFNWVVARQSGGALVLRIEDTDASRNRPEWTEGIVRALAWLGIGPDQYEGPFLQSDNLPLHQAAAQRMYEQGRAYYCDCTREAIVARTGDSHRGYDGYCRDRSLGPADGRALRFRTPDEGATVVADVVRGKTTFENVTLEDFVIARGNGSVLFLLANVIDDITQRINLVIRAEEHLSNTPKQQLLWAALGQDPPTWAHVPIIVNEKRQKLSKRRDKVALEDFRDEGYLASAMRNYLMLLGWAPRGDREIVSWETIESEFRLADVNPSPAFFDVKKLQAFNAEYIRALSVADFVRACQPWLTAPAAPWPADRFDPAVFAQLAPLAQTRVGVLTEITAMVDFAFLDEPATDEASWTSAMKGPAAQILADAQEAYADATWQADELRVRLEEIAARHELSLRKVQAPVRVAVTGRTVGLPLFESLQVLGRDQTLRRLQAARERLAART